MSSMPTDDPRENPTDRLPILEISPILYVRGPFTAGYLLLPWRTSWLDLADPVPAHWLKGGAVRLLCALARAWAEDEALPQQLRGWRTAAQIGDLIGKLARYRLPVDAATVVKYICLLRKELGGIPIIDTRLGAGYRLAEPLTIVDSWCPPPETGEAEG